MINFFTVISNTIIMLEGVFFLVERRSQASLFYFMFHSTSVAVFITLTLDLGVSARARERPDSRCRQSCGLSSQPDHVLRAVIWACGCGLP